MKKILLLAILSTIVSCSPRSTSESEALLNEIHNIKSRTKVGINYIDYSKAVQELQIKLDDFERSEESKKIKYAGNLVATANEYITASEKEYGDWNPQYDWLFASYYYEYMDDCINENKNCYSYEDKTSLELQVALDISEEISNEIISGNN